MTHPQTIKGRLTGPRSVELDEPVSDAASEIGVIVWPPGSSAKRLSIEEFFDSLPPGTRSKEDIDRQLREERDSWGDR